MGLCHHISHTPSIEGLARIFHRIAFDIVKQSALATGVLCQHWNHFCVPIGVQCMAFIEHRIDLIQSPRPTLVTVLKGVFYRFTRGRMALYVVCLIRGVAYTRMHNSITDGIPVICWYSHIFSFSTRKYVVNVIKKWDFHKSSFAKPQ